MGIFTEILIVLLLSIIIVALCRRVNFPPILGYIVVGAFIAAVIHGEFTTFSDLNGFAKYGVVFLLFTIGLEFSIGRLLTMRSIVFGLGSMQMMIVGGLTWAVAAAFKLPASACFVLAASFAMSSTAIVSKILNERGELGTNIGRIAMGILIFQDMMIVPAIIILGVFSQDLDHKIGVTLLIELVKGVITFMVIIFAGKEVFTPIFNEVARSRSPELFMLATLFAALSAAYFSELMGMSSALGAFLAGTVLAGTNYHHQIDNDIRPFRDVLLGVFFIGVGAMIDIHFALQHFLWIGAIALLILAINFFAISLFLVKTHTVNRVEALKVGLLLSQAGEFGFVLVSLARGYHFLQNEQAQILLGAIVLSMFMSIVLVRFQHRFLPSVGRLLFGKDKPYENQEAAFLEVDNNTVIIGGFSRVGQWVAKSLVSHRHRYLALDLDSTLVNQARLAGDHVIYADIGDSNILQKIHFNEAKAAVLTFQNPSLSLRVLEQMRLLNPDIPILVRTKNDKDVDALMAAGATEVIPDALEASLMLSIHLLVSLGLDLSKAVRWADHLREDRYQILKAYFQGEDDPHSNNFDIDIEDCRTLEVAPTDFCCGKSLKELNLKRLEVKLMSLQRNDRKWLKVPLKTVVEANDVIVIAGSQPDLERAQSFLLTGVREI